MIKTTYFMLKNHRGEMTWSQVVMAVLAAIVIVIFFIIAFKSKTGMGSVIDEMGTRFFN
mgnify:FL=1